MDNNGYLELTSSIDSYLATGNPQTLTSIQNCIETKEDCREKLMEDLVKYHENYIQVFSTDDQVKIVTDLATQIEHRGFLAFRISWMLPYVSEEALNQILSTADDFALVKIMYQIKGNIKAIGKRFCDSSTYFWLHTTNIFSRMSERIMWHKIYRKCRRNLNK